MRISCAAAIIVVTLLSAPVMADTFFGISGDMRIDQLPNCKPGRTDFHFDCVVPDAAPVFTKVEVNFDPARGVCAVSARSDVVHDETAARKLFADVLAFAQSFKQARVVPAAKIEQDRAGQFDPWFDEKRHYGYGFEGMWMFDSKVRTDRLRSFTLNWTKAMLPKPSLSFSVEADFGDSAPCYPPNTPPRYTIRELAPALPK